MATSPRVELRIVNITEFEQNDDDDQWRWLTRLPDGEVFDNCGGRGFPSLGVAVADFFEHENYDPTAECDPADQHYSKLYEAHGREYHIRKYAYGAPEPYEAV